MDMFEPTPTEMRACVEREIKFRERVYPRQVAGKHMTQTKADREIAVMRAVLKHLEVCAFDNEPNLRA